MGSKPSCISPRSPHPHSKQNGSVNGRGSGRKTQKKPHHSLSVTFNLNYNGDQSMSDSVVNINSATEEELMTLPGIDRSTAANIIRYRQLIGQYRKVEDLALVSGVGADKFCHIRSEITVGSSNHSESRPCARSRSFESSLYGKHRTGHSQVDRNGVSLDHMVNINTASLLELTKVNGVNVDLALNIMAHREIEGLYESVDDLLKVKGISKEILHIIRPHVSLHTTSVSSAILSCDPTVCGKGYHRRNGMATLPLFKAGQLCQLQHQSVTSLEKLLPSLGPVSKRPYVSEPVLHGCKNQGVVRVATWNLEQCSLDKIKNPGVKDVVCMTILENGFGIVAVQELTHDKVLEEICRELNKPSLHNTRRWSGHRGRWKCVLTQVTSTGNKDVEYNGFLYDTTQKIELVAAGLLEEKTENGHIPFLRIPYMGLFKVNDQFDCVVVSTQLTSSGIEPQGSKSRADTRVSSTEFLSRLSNFIPEEKNIIIAGDLNIGCNSDDTEKMKKNGYTGMIEEDSSTTANTVRQTDCGSDKSYCDNIWTNRYAHKAGTGRKGVVREGLSSPWIPNGWKWGGVASHHCPVYVELCTSREDMGSGELPIRAEEIRFILADSA